MSKGSSPRNNHSDQFRSNYDDINWSGNADYHSEQSEIFMGMVRQSLGIPLSSTDDQSSDTCCGGSCDQDEKD